MAYNGNPYGGPVAVVQYHKYKFNNSGNKKEFTNKSAHDFRLDEESKKSPHIDHDRSHLNRILVDDKHYTPVTVDGKPMVDENGEYVVGDYNFVKAVEDKYEEIQKKEAEYNKEHGIARKDRKFRIKNVPNKDNYSSTMAVGLIMKLTDGFDKLPEGIDLDKWVDDSMNWVKQTWGEENIIHAVLHMDEYTPHIHVMLSPVTNDGRLSARDWLEGSEDYSRAHQSYFEAVKQPGIQRAIPGMTYEFNGPDAQRQAQSALKLRNDVEILPPVRQNETADNYKKRADNNAKTFAKQKYLEIQTLQRKNEAEQKLLQEQIAASEQRAVQAEEKEKKEALKAEEYRTKYIKEKQDKEFYEKQLSGSGVTRQQLKNSASLIQDLQAQHTQEVRSLTIKNAKTQERLDETTKKFNALQKQLVKAVDENQRLKTVIDANGITDVMLLNHKNMEYIKYGLENMPGDRAEQFKREMLYWLKTGKDVKDIDLSKDPIIE